MSSTAMMRGTEMRPADAKMSISRWEIALAETPPAASTSHVSMPSAAPRGVTREDEHSPADHASKAALVMPEMSRVTR